MLRAGFARHGIDTCVHTKPQRAGCEYILSYSARRSWYVVPYLTRILGPERREVARAELAAELAGYQDGSGHRPAAGADRQHARPRPC